MLQGYGSVTNATGSYFHEFIGFENVIVPALLIDASAVVPSQSAFETAVAQPVAMSQWDETASAERIEQTYSHDVSDDHIYALLASEQMRSQSKKDKWFEQDNWMAEFEKLALLELRK
jgi:hypothetical protein